MATLKPLRKINNKDIQGNTVFDIIESKDVKALKKYIREGGNINQKRHVLYKRCFLSKEKPFLETVLYHAIYIGHFPIIVLLLENNVPINDEDAEILAQVIMS